jgi:4-amino-4-deoxy-L-arabinose transferase-like glycosyltransferase
MNLFLSNWRRTALSIFFLALLTRVAFILTQQNGFYFPDSLLYSRVAVNLLSAGEFGPDFGLAPGYPVFLAAVYLPFGQNIFAIRLVESFMGAFLAVIIATIGRRVGGELIGALAGIIWAIYPLGIFVAGLVYPQGLGAMLLAAGVYCVLPATHEELSAKRVFFGGLFLGLAALAIPIALLTIVVVAAWVFYWARHSRFFLASLLLLGSAVSLAPWTARNFLVHGRLIPVQADFEGHFRKARMMTPEGKIVIPEDNTILLRLYVVRVLRNFMYFWELYPSRMVMSNQDYRDELHANDSRVVKETIYIQNSLITALSILSTGPIFVFAILGTVAIWPRRDVRRELSILWIMVLSFALGYTFFTGKIRYRIPVEPYLIILSAYGIHATWSMISGRFESAVESNGSVISDRST